MNNIDRMVNKCIISILMVVGQEYCSCFKTSTCVHISKHLYLHIREQQNIFSIVIQKL